jgi:hypothetical protein
MILFYARLPFVIKMKCRAGGDAPAQSAGMLGRCNPATLLFLFIAFADGRHRFCR